MKDLKKIQSAYKRDLKEAEKAANAGDISSAGGHIDAADQKAAVLVAAARTVAVTPTASPKQKADAKKIGDEAINTRKVLREAKDVVMPTLPNAAPAASVYAAAGGLVQAPPGAGAYMRVPLNLQGQTNWPVGFFAAGAVTTLTMETPELPWLQYRVRGILIERQSNAAGAADMITVSDFKEGGGPNLILAEGEMGVESFRMGDSHMIGLRYNPIVTAPNKLQLTATAQAIGGGVTAGETRIIASAVIETIEDSTYGQVNNLMARLNQGHFGGGQGAGFVHGRGVAPAGTLQRIPLRGSNGEVGFSLATNAAVTLTSEQISWAQVQVVGLEIANPILGAAAADLAKDLLLVEDLKVNGGASLLPAESFIPAINFLGDEGGSRGGGMHTFVGLRHYPVLGSTNQASLSLRASDISGAAGTFAAPTAAIVVPYVNLIVQTLSDDVFGAAQQPAFAQAAQSPRAGGRIARLLKKC